MIAALRLLVFLGLSQPVAAQGNHLVVVTGLSGEPQFAKRFADAAGRLLETATTRWGVTDSSAVYLTEDGTGTKAAGKASREAIVRALGGIAQRAAPNDVVMLVLFGHGSQQGTSPLLSLPGPDLSAADLATALAVFPTQTVIVVNAASASGDFVAALSGERRVIVTATKTGFERNATVFGDHFVRGLASGEADTDKDGRVSIAEAFTFAKQEVARQYQSQRKLLTEHAILDDNGDRTGSVALGDSAKDGSLARAVAFDLAANPLANDPRAAGLLAERRRLERLVAELRQRKATMDSTAYEQELERLLLKLAETNQALRALERKS